jgi:hypothetical protein
VVDAENVPVAPFVITNEVDVALFIVAPVKLNAEGLTPPIDTESPAEKLLDAVYVMSPETGVLITTPVIGPEIMSTRFPVRIDAHPAAVPPLDHVPEVVAGVVEPRVKLLALPTAVTVPDAFKVLGVISVTVTGSLTEKP